MATAIGGVRWATTASTTSCETAAASLAQLPVRVADAMKLFRGLLHCPTGTGVFINSIQ